jgi:putative glycosyltransferase (TIGR04348 family)
MRIALVMPAQAGARSGNETTTERWRQILERRGHEVIVLSNWQDEACDLLVALHANKSLKSIERFRRAHPHKPVIVALTGTDIYGDLAKHGDPWRSLESAARLIVLQPLALLELPEPLRQKARVIYQSVDPQELAASAGEHARDDAETFDVCVIAHLREVKDPLRTAYAARLLPAESKIRVIHLGGGLSPEAEREAREEMSNNRRFRWLGNVPRSVALARLAQSDLMVMSSLREGGANAIGEAIAAGVPIVASRIPGNIGLLGEDYEGYFEAGDEAGLAQLLWRLERDRAALERLRALQRAPPFVRARTRRANLGRAARRGRALDGGRAEHGRSTLEVDRTSGTRRPAQASARLFEDAGPPRDVAARPARRRVAARAGLDPRRFARRHLDGDAERVRPCNRARRRDFATAGRAGASCSGGGRLDRTRYCGARRDRRRAFSARCRRRCGA